MTPEELNDNYEYKLLKRALLKDFPFITDISVRPEELRKYQSSIFVNLYIDLRKFYELTGITVPSWLSWYIREGKVPDFSLLSFISYADGEVDKDKAKQIQHGIETIMRQINNSKAIPQELKLPINNNGHRRGFNIGDILMTI